MPADDRPLPSVDAYDDLLGRDQLMSTPPTRASPSRPPTAAIEQGCRMLRLPTIRDRFSEIAAAAEREQLSYLGFLSELVIAECDDRDPPPR